MPDVTGSACSRRVRSRQRRRFGGGNWQDGTMLGEGRGEVHGDCFPVWVRQSLVRSAA